MDRRSRSVESPRRYRNGGGSSNCGGSGSSRRDHRRYSRSRSRSRDRMRRRSRSRSRDRISSNRRGDSNEKDLYRDIINDDYQDDKMYGSTTSSRAYSRGGGGGAVGDYDRDRDYERERDRGRRHGRRYNSTEREREREREREYSEDSDDSSYHRQNCSQIPSNTIIVLRLRKHITEADIVSALIQSNVESASAVRLIRKRDTGASRGFAFVEFNTIEKAVRWMEITQGTLMLSNNTRAELQYSHSRGGITAGTGSAGAENKVKANLTDWYCGICGVYNFKRRFNCFRCSSSRAESEKGGEGSDEISNILTKKIMLRNLDALTNEEGVLTAMQQHFPELAKKISKILISRDLLTQTSRGVCYLNFENLVDSMNLHNALNAMEPPLLIDNREIMVSYCVDQENRQMSKKSEQTAAAAAAAANTATIGPLTAAELAAQVNAANAEAAATAAAAQYTLADVPRLAEYSAAMYASTPAEHAHYMQYYTEYYIDEIKKGCFGNLPTNSQMTEGSANSGAAVALNAIQRKQKKMSYIETTATQAAAAAAQAAAAAKAAIAAAQTIVTPKGNDGKTYPTPNVSLYQYDETSGYYYDPTTGLYYDAHSQYYYNSETGAYLYWDQRKSTYVLATPAAAAAAVQDVLKEGTAGTTNGEDDAKKEKKDVNKHDKVKVAKKIVKDMEKWAKQLNQKKDYTAVATPQPILGAGAARAEENVERAAPSSISRGYADVGFSILEKKERIKNTDFLATAASSKIASGYGSDSDEEQQRAATLSLSAAAARLNANATSTTMAGASAVAETSEKDYVDFQKLTCLLCKRAFQSTEILQKHLQMSNLHKENLQKYNLARSSAVGSSSSEQQEAYNNSLSYRDRAKERRKKYGESDPPPPNRSRERFEQEMQTISRKAESAAAPLPISSSNVGSRLLQKMGWSEGQGLGRQNQGRTNIIEAESRQSTAGLGSGSKAGMAPGVDYKTYIKKMMKSRYESV